VRKRIDPIEIAQQRTIRRSRLFVVLPLAIVFALTANLVWEVLRVSHSSLFADRTSIPSVVDASTTVGLIGAASGLMLARMQWVRTVRPILDMRIEPKSVSEPGLHQQWNFELINAGPGIGILQRLDFRIAFRDTPAEFLDDRFVDRVELQELLRRHGWNEHVDYWTKWMTRGAPVPVHGAPDEAVQIAWFTSKCIMELRTLDVRIQVQDVAGDTHERIFPCVFFIREAVQAQLNTGAALRPRPSVEAPPKEAEPES
jgi:hypothetical protein